MEAGLCSASCDRDPSLVGRFSQAALAYPQALRWLAQQQHLLDRLNLWAGAARGVSSMLRLRRVLETQAVPLNTLAVTLASIHAAKGDQ